MSGYYGGGARPAPVTIIKSVLYRNNPIILGSPPFLGASRGILSSRGILIWNELEALGIPNIIGGQLLLGHDASLRSSKPIPATR